MVPLFVFYLHTVGMAAAFTKWYQDEGLKEGILAVLLMTLIFFVGWSISSFLLKLVMDPPGFGKLFDRDSASLALLTVMEAGCYYLFFRKSNSETREPKQ